MAIVAFGLFSSPLVKFFEDVAGGYYMVRDKYGERMVVMDGNGMLVTACIFFPMAGADLLIWLDAETNDERLCS